MDKSVVFMLNYSKMSFGFLEILLKFWEVKGFDVCN